MIKLFSPNKKTLYLFSVIFMNILFNSCEKEQDFNCIVSSGNFKTSKIDLDDFDQIKIYVESDVVINQGSKSKIQLEGNAALVDSIYSAVENKKLIVELKSPYCNPDIPLKISITTPNLKELVINEKGNTIIHDFKNQQKLKLQINSDGNIELNELKNLDQLKISLQEGATIQSKKRIPKVNFLKIDIKGNGVVMGYPIIAQDVEIRIEGRGSCEITAINSLYVDIVGNANVYCKGIPTLHKRITGRGNVYFTN